MAGLTITQYTIRTTQYDKTVLNKKLKTARNIAAETLERFDLKNDYAATILNKLLDETNQRQRATDIVYGTLRNYLAIDTVLEKIGECTIKRISPKLLNIIRIAIYELVYCPQTAKYSILNEAVEITKTIAGQKQAGFVNAILRKIERAVKNRQTPLEKANTEATIVQDLSSGCEFNKSFLPPADINPADYFSVVFSLPKWLIADWRDEFGLEKTKQICFGSNRKPSIYVRPNTLKITAEELAEKFTQEKIETVSTGSPSNQILPNESMLLVKSPKAIVNLPGFAGGLFSVQDITASKPVKILNPKPNWKILDLCAAPGTKTTQLAEYTNDAAEIVATDIDSERLKKVSENIKRLGVKSIKVVEYEKLFCNSQFNAVLLDVPCSNTGVLAKRIELRRRINKKAINELTKIQMQLLLTAAEALKPNGKICYSTCSIQTKENSELINKFITENKNFKLEKEKLTLPSAENFGCDGGYAAVITKK